MLVPQRKPALRWGLGEEPGFPCGATVLPSAHCLYETVQKLRIKAVEAGVYLAHESDDASCVF